MAINTLSIAERIVKGKETEVEILDCLNEHYLFNLTSSSLDEDKFEKTDAWDDTGNRYAIKYRENHPAKTDILIAMRDPFYGINHERTVIGRDVKVKYHKYVVLTKFNSTIWVVNGDVVHNIYESLWREFEEKIVDIDINSKQYDSKFPIHIMDSSEFSGCQIWLCRDRGKGYGAGRPKLLGFLSPAIFKENEFASYKFI